jgi:hypothetical protein
MSAKKSVLGRLDPNLPRAEMQSPQPNKKRCVENDGSVVNLTGDDDSVVDLTNSQASPASNSTIDNSNADRQAIVLLPGHRVVPFEIHHSGGGVDKYSIQIKDFDIAPLNVVVDKFCPDKVNVEAPLCSIKRRVHQRDRRLRSLAQDCSIVSMAVELARQHHLSPEVQNEFARVAGIDISEATPLEKIEAARLGLNLDYFYGVVSFGEVMHFDSVIDNNLASLGASQSMVLHTGGSATKTSVFSLVASYCSTEELSNHVFEMDQSEVNRGNHEYLDGVYLSDTTFVSRSNIYLRSMASSMSLRI